MVIFSAIFYSSRKNARSCIRWDVLHVRSNPASFPSGIVLSQPLPNWVAGEPKWNRETGDLPNLHR